MENKEIIKSIEGALKDHGVDWILNEKYPNSGSFDVLMEEIKLAITKLSD